MKLISMVDYVLANPKEDHVNYANFLNQPLKLEMFVPCVDGEPFNYSKHGLKEDFEIAKEKVLFEGIPMNEIDIQMLMVYAKKEKTIEELFNESADLDFTLTPSGIKKCQ